MRPQPGTFGNAVTFNHNANTFGGSFNGNGANVTNVNAATLGGLASSNFWKTSGNAGANPTNGAYLGTTDNLPLEIKVNGAQVLRLEYGYDSSDASVAPNLIGGYSGNTVSDGVFGTFIGGGGNAGKPNRADGDYASGLGGYGNTAHGYVSTTMGEFNTPSGNYSTAMGCFASAAHQGSFVWADSTSSARFNSTANNQFLIRAGGGVGIGTASPQSALRVTPHSSIARSALRAVMLADIAGRCKAAPPERAARWLPASRSSTGRSAFPYAHWYERQCGHWQHRPVAKTHCQWQHSRQRHCQRGQRPQREGTFPVRERPRCAGESLGAAHHRMELQGRQRNAGHIGPMAQDFCAALKVGMDDKHIGMVDADGVALAAIQGLNQKLEQKETGITELKQRLEALEKIIRHQDPDETTHPSAS